MNPIKTHTFVVNPSDNSGEHLSVVTKFIPNGDKGVVFTNHTIALQSYCNSATIDLGTELTPQVLRQLANELEKAKTEAVWLLSLSN